MATTVATSRASTDGRRQALRKVPFFVAAPPELQEALIEASSVVRIPADEYFLREGDSCAHFAILVSGKMRVFKLAESGHEITLYHVGPGEVCPLNVSCILSDRPVPAMAMVEENVEAIAIPSDTFRRLMAQFEPLRTFIFQMFATRLAEVMSLVEEVAFKRMDQRLARRLTELFKQGDGSYRDIEITHAEIAAELGTAREVVSRLLKEFERLGAVRLSRGRIVLRNAALLQEIASGEVERRDAPAVPRRSVGGNPHPR